MKNSFLWACRYRLGQPIYTAWNALGFGLVMFYEERVGPAALSA